jgi:hypothetical protein
MLTTEDVKLLLLRAAARDGRTWPDEATFAVVAAVWAEDLDDAWLTPEIAMEAQKRHYRSESRRIMPADLIGWAQEIRRERLGRVRMPDPPTGAPSALWDAAYAAAEAAILAGSPDAPPAELHAAAAEAMAAVFARPALNGSS